MILLVITSFKREYRRTVKKHRPELRGGAFDAYRRLRLDLGLIEPSSRNAAIKRAKQMAKTTTERNKSPKIAAMPVAAKR